MNQKQNIFSSPPKQNSTNFFTKNSNFPSNSILSNDKSKITLIPSIQRKKHNVVKKRTYNELMESLFSVFSVFFNFKVLVGKTSFLLKNLSLFLLSDLL